MTIYLVSNSPGEVSTFVKPVVKVLRRRQPQWKIQVCLVPCPYATGAEKSVVESWEESPQVWSPWQTTKAWLKGKGRGKPGVVVFLGGDPWHALLLKSRFELPCLAYFSEPTSWEKTKFCGGFDRLAVGYERGPGPSNRLRQKVGDLRVDAVRAQLSAVHAEEKDESLTLALFPGSRWLHLKAVLGPFLEMLDQVRAVIPQLRILLAASPFVSPERLADAAARPLSLGLSSTTAHLSDRTLVTEAGTEIEVVWGDPYRVMAQCDLAVSLPGTNTAELAIAGKPTILPLTSRVPVGGGGLLGVLDRLPGFVALKRRLRERKKKRLSLIALPNQLAGRMIMPEMMIRDDLTDLSEAVVSLLQDPARCRAIGRQAQEVMGPAGGAEEIVDMVEELTRRVG